MSKHGKNLTAADLNKVFYDSKGRAWKVEKGKTKIKQTPLRVVVQYKNGQLLNVEKRGVRIMQFFKNRLFWIRDPKNDWVGLT
jgi:hypothetical protein